MNDTSVGRIVNSILIIICIGIVVGGLVGCPKYMVYYKTLKGKSALREAEWNRKITIEEANAEFEAAKYIKLADSTRAVGTAIANRIIAKSLTTQYIQWKWVEGLHDGSSETIYIPTEANLPILEATRGINK